MFPVHGSKLSFEYLIGVEFNAQFQCSLIKIGT